MTIRLREELRLHQQATGCTDDHMVGILCDFLIKLDKDEDLVDTWHEALLSFVVDNLEQGPPA